jgi:protein gp37
MNLDKNIGWCTHQHNIMTGCCHPFNPTYKGNPKIRACPYCYACKRAENPFYRKAFPYGFEPHFYEERINEVRKLRKPAIIFMDSMSDTFGEWWTEEQILKILHIMDCFRGVHWHKYVVLTKNPRRMYEILAKYAETDGADHLGNVYFGTSVTGAYDERGVRRIVSLWGVHNLGYKTVLSMEPLLHHPERMIDAAGGINWLDWLIIGGQTKPTKIPEYEWVKELAFSVMNQVPVFSKENCGDKIIQKSEFPADLLPIARAWGKI